ncbi:hypothetical protein BH10BAC5_BH10BAC5_23600 [soil metagenome]
MSSLGKKYRRFSASVIIQHLILTIATLLLIVTGLPLKYFTSGWAIWTMKLLGGTAKARELHHLAALMLIFVGVFHLCFIIFTKTGRKDLKDFMPVKKDFYDVKNQFMYFFGKRKVSARFGRFSYIEKFDYWAVYWGFVIMIGTGLVMWFYQAKLNPLFIGEINLNFLPEFTNYYIHAISRELHSDEALLATLAIIGWHFYNVIFNPDVFPVNKSIFTGHLTQEEMERDHPYELEQINIKESINEEVELDERNEKDENIDETLKENEEIQVVDPEVKNKGNVNEESSVSDPIKASEQTIENKITNKESETDGDEGKKAKD